MVQPARPRLAPAGLMFWSGQCRKVNAFGVEIRWADLGTSGHILVKRLHKTSLKWYPCCVVVEVRQYFPKNSAVNHHTYIKCRKTGWIRLIYVWNEYGVDTTCFLIQTYTHTQLYNHVTTKLRIEWIRIINMKDLFSDRFQMLKRAKARWGLLNCSWLCQNAQHCTAVLWAQLFSSFFSGRSRCSSKQWASTLLCTASWRRRLRGYDGRLFRLFMRGRMSESMC